MNFDNTYKKGGRPSATAIAQASNLYVYCIGNPILYIDPLGLSMYVIGGDGKVVELDPSQPVSVIDGRGNTTTNDNWIGIRDRKSTRLNSSH